MTTNRKDAAWHERRRQGIGGSDCTIIMHGEPADVMRLWRVKRGVEASEDLSDVLPVRIGEATEDLNIEWAERTLGPIHARHQRISCERWPTLTVELDGVVKATNIPVECKHVNMMANIGDVALKYQPQTHAVMLATGATKCWLSVFLGTLKYELVPIEFDGFYAEELMGQIQRFWVHVQAGTPPVIEAAIAPPPPPAAVNYVSFDLPTLIGTTERPPAAIPPNWAVPIRDELKTWLDTVDAAKKNEAAEKAIKKLLPDNCGKLTEPGILVTRSKSAAVSIKKEKAA